MMESPCFRALLRIKSFADDRANPESGSVTGVQPPESLRWFLKISEKMGNHSFEVFISGFFSCGSVIFVANAFANR